MRRSSCLCSACYGKGPDVITVGFFQFFGFYPKTWEKKVHPLSVCDDCQDNYEEELGTGTGTNFWVGNQDCATACTYCRNYLGTATDAVKPSTIYGDHYSVTVTTRAITTPTTQLWCYDTPPFDLRCTPIEDWGNGVTPNCNLLNSDWVLDWKACGSASFIYSLEGLGWLSGWWNSLPDSPYTVFLYESEDPFFCDLHLQVVLVVHTDGDGPNGGKTRGTFFLRLYDASVGTGSSTPSYYLVWKIGDNDGIDCSTDSIDSGGFLDLDLVYYGDGVNGTGTPALESVLGACCTAIYAEAEFISQQPGRQFLQGESDTPASSPEADQSPNCDFLTSSEFELDYDSCNDNDLTYKGFFTLGGVYCDCAKYLDLTATLSRGPGFEVGTGHSLAFLMARFLDDNGKLLSSSTYQWSVDDYWFNGTGTDPDQGRPGTGTGHCLNSLGYGGLLKTRGLILSGYGGVGTGAQVGRCCRSMNAMIRRMTWYNTPDGTRRCSSLSNSNSYTCTTLEQP